MSDILNDCGCCGFGFEKFTTMIKDIVVVGHGHLTNTDGKIVNLSALDLQGDVLWQLNMGQDSLGQYKRPVHIRFSSSGFIYVAWNSITVQSPAGSKVIQNNATTGGVDKFNRNGERMWSAGPFPAQAAASGGLSYSYLGNCVDVSPYDGTIWTSTYRDVNNNFVHQLNHNNGAIIQSFGEAEFLAAGLVIPILTGGMAVVSWMRITESGNIWFTMMSTNENNGGPFKCDSSGFLLRAYPTTFGPGFQAPRIFPCNSIVVMGEDDIVFAGGQTGIGSTQYHTPPPGQDLVERWNAAAGTKTWGTCPGDHPISWKVTSGAYTYNQLWANWLDGDLSKFVYGMLRQYEGSAGHQHSVFCTNGAGSPSFSSTAWDSTSFYSDPRDLIVNPSCIACLPDHVFAAGNRFRKISLPEDTTLLDSMVVSLAPNTGRRIWCSDLKNASAIEPNQAISIAAFKES